jgi:hypothetical protein
VKKEIAMRVRRLLVGVALMTCGTAVALAAVNKLSTTKQAVKRGQPSLNNPLDIKYEYSKPGSIVPYEKEPITRAVLEAKKQPTQNPDHLKASKQVLERTLAQSNHPQPGVEVEPITCGGQYCSAVVVYPDIAAFVLFDRSRIGDPHSPLATWRGGAGRTPLARRGGALVSTWYTFELAPHNGG